MTKKLAVFSLIIILAFSLPTRCLADSSAGHPVFSDGYFKAENAPVFDARLIRQEACGNTPELFGSEEFSGRYSGIVFEGEDSPYCSGSDRQWNTDHSQYSTEVGDQMSLGTCWLFSGLGTFESAVLKRYGKTLNLSEMYALYAVSNAKGVINNPYPAYHHLGYTYSASTGGNESILMAYLAREAMGSIVTEDGLGYSRNPAEKTLEEIQKTGETYASAYYPSQMITLGENLEYEGKNYCALTGAAYIRETKDLIKAFGAVTAGIYDNGNDSDYAASYGYCPDGGFVSGSYDTNHQIEIVGWDDDYGSSGAFLVKNSRGDDWNGDGYFWMSYDCYITGVMAISSVCLKSELYDRVYETDCSVPGIAGRQNAGAGCFMKRTYETADASESLTAVMLYNAAPGTGYSVYVTDEDAPSEDTVWIRPVINNDAAVTVDGVSGRVTASDAGYLTLRFAEPVAVSGRYTVAVTVCNTESDYMILGTNPYDSMADSACDSVFAAMDAEPLDSSVFSGISSTKSLNFVLKAFTKSSPSADYAVIPAVYEGGAQFDAADGTASISLNVWKGEIGALPVYLSESAGNADPFISAEITEDKLTLSADAELPSVLASKKLSGYIQRCYIGVRDENGVEFRVPVTAGRNIEPDSAGQLLVLKGSIPEAEKLGIASYDHCGQMLGYDVYDEVFYGNGRIFIPDGVLGLDSHVCRVFKLDSGWRPLAAPIDLNMF